MKSHIITGLCIILVGAAAGIGLSKWISVAPKKPADNRVADPTDRLRTLQNAFTRVSNKAVRSVVHITSKMSRRSNSLTESSRSKNVGSGVIVSDRGHILTNNHVVRGAKELHVLFSNGMQFDAQIIGQDSDSDLALLRIEVPEGFPLRPIAFADSNKARVGEWVLAIGSPFGYNHTVTQGIISAKHRRANMNLPFQDFIQTDAAINPGNSGGALINLDGELVGINTAIVSETRRSEGVGLAIAANLVKSVYVRLARDGRVRRGLIGVYPESINEKLIYDLRQVPKYREIRTIEDLLDELGMEHPVGAFVTESVKDGPAYNAGIRRGDVIIEFNGAPVQGKTDLFGLVEFSEPGMKIDVKYLRDGKENIATIELAERPQR